MRYDDFHIDTDFIIVWHSERFDEFSKHRVPNTTSLSG